MSQCRRALRPDGLFLAAMLGGITLQEPRIACTAAQLEREGGVSPVVSPLAQVRDAGNLLGRAALAVPAVDVDDVVVRYHDTVEMVLHMRAMGEGNALRQRRPTLPRDVALAAAALLPALFGEEDGKNGVGSNEGSRGDTGSVQSVPVTYEVVYMTGWAPDPSQRGPAARGSAGVSLQDLAAAVAKAEGEGASGGGARPGPRRQGE
jgi:NADH dehydrogenase [ubiquinone] 1 alpha subcomplex assembly factor 5